MQICVFKDIRVCVLKPKCSIEVAGNRCRLDDKIPGYQRMQFVYVK